MKDAMSFRPSKSGPAALEQSQLRDQIVWSEDENIYRPSPRPLAEFLSTVELIPQTRMAGENQGDSLLVFVEQSCMKKMQAHAHEEIQREQVGILCGQAFIHGNERHYVTITSAIPVAAQSGAAYFRFHERSWDPVWRNIERSCNVIGWYHTHPGMGAFLSRTDLRTQQLYFQSPWQVAVVIDPVVHETRCFSGAGGVNVPENNWLCYVRKF